MGKKNLRELNSNIDIPLSIPLLHSTLFYIFLYLSHRFCCLLASVHCPFSSVFQFLDQPHRLSGAQMCGPYQIISPGGILMSVFVCGGPWSCQDAQLEQNGLTSV